MINVLYHNKFKKDFRRMPKQIQDKFHERMIIFMKNPFDPLLDNHELHREYKGYRSITIAHDVRVVYQLRDGVAMFVAIGTHSQLY